MSADVFLDTNILVYGVVQGDARTPRAESLLRQGCTISVQVLNEFTNVARRKLRRTWPEINQAVGALRVLFPEPKAILPATHAAALVIAQREGFAFYDSLIIASAIEAGCSTLLSEDMQSGRVIADGLTIRNPFL
ncbi:MAG TPA: PIN domain-containing protein [Rhodopila sp.]|jgi:predicted nucleic acid-binding protein